MSCINNVSIPINYGCDDKFQREKRKVLTTSQYGEMKIIKRLFKQYNITEFRQEEDKRNEVQIHYEDEKQNHFVWILKNDQIY